MLTADRNIDRRILLEADSLESNGWDVKIIAMPTDDGAADHDPRIVRIGGEAPGGRENFVLHIYRNVRRHIPMNGGLMRLMKRLAWRYLVDQESFYMKLFMGAAQRFTPQVFVAHDLPMLPVAYHASRLCGAKLVYDSHELFTEQEFGPREKRRWTEIESAYIGACDRVIAVNPSAAEELKQRYQLPRVDVIMNAERLADVAVPNKIFHQFFHLLPDRKILLLQGGLSAGRNLETLVEAMQHIANPLIHLVFLGDGRFRKVLESKVVARKLTGRVHFHDAVPQKELLAYTAAADVGVIPYRATCLNNYYCTPNKLFEFIAVGVPVLASDLPEIKRIVTGHDMGRVGDMRDAKATAMLIDDFFRSEEQLALWRRNALKASNVINWDVEGRKLVSLYEGLR